MTCTDLTKPSFAAAYAIARETARKQGPEAAAAQMAKLLFHVEFHDGGFLGASDGDEIRIAAIRRRFGITPEQYVSALYDHGEWPTAQAEKRDAA